MRILIAVDDSWSSGEGVKVFLDQVRSNGSQVRVIHVLQPIAVSAPPQMSPEFTPELQDLGIRAKNLLEDVGQTIRNAGFQVETILRKGDIRGMILQEAEEWPADLIVLGSHGYTGAQRLFLGSVAESVAKHARCSVEIVRLRRAH
jgi:nucleotide-binding universal stress UspA family protein